MHLFIYADYVKILGLVVSTLSSGLVIDTPINGSVNTSLICLSCPLSIYGRYFGVDLTCMPLSDLDVIMGMIWLEFSHVHINFYNKSVRFLAPDNKEETSFIYAGQLEELLKYEAKVFVMFASFSVESQTIVKGLSMVCEILEVFPDDISNLPPKRDMEFAIDLVPSTSPVYMAPYRMSESELGELEYQLGDLLEKKFIRPSVSLWRAPVLLVKKKDGSMQLYVDYR
ncbi:uncharacterized protein LOC127079737 [Lathyrus oleraceus]|uniref:uncharacterized protein LOC127079737 n=1 Tax=Pisum sativum TaxID=3888 RepID=UPI0021D0FC53|nr:uncharacterized protein LOC127079737 [Pisum sativum]